MVIISTSATDVSIQAVSPEFGVHLSSTLASQVGGAVSTAAVAAGVAGACANAVLVMREPVKPSTSNTASSITSRLRGNHLAVMGFPLLIAESHA
jgi:hypothetical protein